MMQDVALVVPLMTKLTPDLSELGSVFFYCTHCLANHVDPPMQGADGPMLFFHLCVSVSSVSELLTDCEFQHLVHCSVSSFFRSLFTVEPTLSGGPISGALLSSQYRWLMPSLFSGVSSHNHSRTSPC